MITTEQVADVIRQGLRGEIDVRRISKESWDDTYCGHVQYQFGGWKLNFFNDCDGLDYLEGAESPEGETYESFDASEESGQNEPTDLLKWDEHKALEAMMKTDPT